MIADLSPDELARYSRHLLLGEIGVDGQRKLKASRVLVIGAGGLGSPAALYLAAAGIGTIGIADFDRVELHNLQRQLLHDDASVGEPKTSSASKRLRCVNPHVSVVEHSEGVTPENARQLFSGYDVIVDGTDTFSTRYLNNDAAVLVERPLVYGSIFRFEGSVAVFAPHLGGPCYRCLFAEAPPAGSVPNCGEAGVLGALCGVIGSLQALETIKIIVGFGKPLIGRMLTYDSLNQQMQTLSLPRDPTCPVCSKQRTIVEIRSENYSVTCSPDSTDRSDTMNPPADGYPLEISVVQANQLLNEQPNSVSLIDVREPYEAEIASIKGAKLIPMRQIPARLDELPRDKHLLIHCHHGARSMRVTEFLRANGYTAVSNVGGGIDAWSEVIDPSLRKY